jgi:DNA-binding Xre family transcriptional regulator
MGKGLHISMETLLRICGALDCDISDVIELEREKSSSGEAEDRIKKSKIPC